MSCSFGLSQTEAGDGFMLGFYCLWVCIFASSEVFLSQCFSQVEHFAHSKDDLEAAGARSLPSGMGEFPTRSCGAFVLIPSNGFPR